MTQVYTLKTAGTSPLSLADAKAFMKVTSTSDDALIQILIDAATEWGQKYTGREFTDNVWTLFLDYFEDRISLNRDPVSSIDSVTYMFNGDVIVPALTYYLKKLVQCSEMLLNQGSYWPTDIDQIEQAISVEFTTKSYYCVNEILEALMMHVSYMYANRGDCTSPVSGVTNVSSMAALSFATIIYDQFRISRI